MGFELISWLIRGGSLLLFVITGLTSALWWRYAVWHMTTSWWNNYNKQISNRQLLDHPYRNLAGTPITISPPLLHITQKLQAVVQNVAEKEERCQNIIIYDLRRKKARNCKIEEVLTEIGELKSSRTVFRSGTWSLGASKNNQGLASWEGWHLLNSNSQRSIPNLTSQTSRGNIKTTAPALCSTVQP